MHPKTDGEPMQFVLKQDLLAITDDFTIQTASGQAAFTVDSKLLSIGDKLVLKDASGHAALTIKEKLIAIRDAYEISRGGARVATVKKALISPLRDRFTVDRTEGEDWDVTGSILDCEYTITEGRAIVATISKRIVAIRDAYGVDVADGADAALVLAVAVVVDLIAHGDEDEDA